MEKILSELACLSLLPDIIVHVTRANVDSYDSSVDRQDIYSWIVTFIHAPGDFPQLSVVDPTSLTGGTDNATPYVTVEVVAAASDPLFSVSFDGSEPSSPLPVDCNGEDMKVALESLSTLNSVSVRKAGNGQGQHDWMVTFHTSTAPPLIGDLPDLKVIPSLDFVESGSTSVVVELQKGEASPDTVMIEVTDGTESGSVSGAIDIFVIPVDDMPVLITPSKIIAVMEDTPTLISGIQVEDVDIGQASLTIELECGNGQILHTQLEFGEKTFEPMSLVSFSGTLLEVNNFLSSISYVPKANFNGIDYIHVSIGSDSSDDLANRVSLVVHPINDAPTITGPTDIFTNEDWEIRINGIVVEDSDSANEPEPYLVEVSLHVEWGYLSFDSPFRHYISYSIGSGQHDAVIVAQGPLDEIAKALQTLSFYPEDDWNGVTTIHLAVNDLGNAGEGGSLEAHHTILITVDSINDAPTLHRPAGVGHVLRMNESEAAIFQHFEIEDSDALETESMEMLVLCSHATLNFNDENVDAEEYVILSEGQGYITYKGTVSTLNMLLRNFTYEPEPNYNGFDTLTIELLDEGRSSDGPPQIITELLEIYMVPINDAPTIQVTGDESMVSTTENALSYLPAITVDDVDVSCKGCQDAMLNVQLEVSHGTVHIAHQHCRWLHLNEELAETGGSSSPQQPFSSKCQGSVLAFNASLMAINYALGSLRYTGEDHFHGDDALLVIVNDLGNTGVDEVVLEASIEVPIVIESINSVPIITIQSPLKDMHIDEGDIIALGGISAQDPDLLEDDLLIIRLSVEMGFIVLSSAFQSGDFRILESSESLIVYETPAALVSSLFANMQYRAPRNFDGIDEMSIRVDGGGGINDVAETSLYLIVDAVNDPPTITNMDGDGGIEIDENTWKALQVEIRDEDVDADAVSAVFQVTIAAEVGSVDCSEEFMEGLAFTRPSVGDVLLTGMLKHINSAFVDKKIVYRPPSDWYGGDSIFVNVDDLGNSGQGENHVTTETISVEVHQVDDLPFFKGPRQMAKVLEDGMVTIANVSISDVDLPTDDTVVLSINCTRGNIMLHMKEVVADNVEFSEGAAGSWEPLLTFRARLADTNVLVRNFDYKPADGFNGKDRVAMVVQYGCVADASSSDSCDTTAVTFELPVLVLAVNNAPVIAYGSAALTTTEDTTIRLSGVFVTDLDVVESQMQIGGGMLQLISQHNTVG